MKTNNKTFIIAELSGNHLQDIKLAKKLIKKSFEIGVDAVKIQTYTPDTISLNMSGVKDKIKKDYHTVKIKHNDWKGMSYNELYSKAYTPWEWHFELDKLAKKYGLILFSTPFDFSSVEYLEKQNVPIYKIASYDLINIPLLKKIAQTKKPVIMSVGMGTEKEIEDAVKTLEENGCKDISLLHCISSYPTLTKDLNLSKIEDLKKKYPLYTIGFSDHSLDINAPAMAVLFGAKIIERHLTLDRKLGGADSSFSSEPDEFKQFIDKIRFIENSGEDINKLKKYFPDFELARGTPIYGPINDFEKSGIEARPSIWINKFIKKEEIIKEEHLKIARPGQGLEPKYYESLIGKKVKKNLEKGIPFSLEFLK